MAVKHLQTVQRQQLAIAMASDPTVLQKFKAGFNECSDEVNKYIDQIEGADSELKERIKSHLQKCITSVEHIAHFNSFAGLGLPFLPNTSTLFPPSLLRTPESGDQNNNPRIQIPQGLQLIPSRLPTGEFAFLVPNSTIPTFSSLSSQQKTLSSDSIPTTSQRPSAFVTVIPSSLNQQSHVNFPSTTRLLSPPLSPVDYLQRPEEQLLIKPREQILGQDQILRNLEEGGLQKSQEHVFKKREEEFLRKPGELFLRKPDDEYGKKTEEEFLKKSEMEVMKKTNQHLFRKSEDQSFRKPEEVINPEEKFLINSEEQTQRIQRSPSPHGFRPVNPAASKEFHKTLKLSGSFDSSTNLQVVPVYEENVQIKEYANSQIVRSFKFPIHNHHEREKKILPSPTGKKFEPLCVITNQAERYKQAQMLEDSARLEENLVFGQKRKFGEIGDAHGLVTIAESRSKFIKTSVDSNPSDIKNLEKKILSPCEKLMKVRNFDSHNTFDHQRNLDFRSFASQKRYDTQKNETRVSCESLSNFEPQSCEFQRSCESLKSSEPLKSCESQRSCELQRNCDPQSSCESQSGSYDQNGQGENLAPKHIIDLTKGNCDKKCDENQRQIERNECQGSNQNQECVEGSSGDMWRPW